MSERTNDINTATPKGFRLGFGIFMVIFYLGIGVVFLLNLFRITEWVTITVGCILIVYGIWRGIRLYLGLR